MKIEELIKSRRDELDLDKAPKGLWQNIQPQLTYQERKATVNWWKVAAVLMVGLFIGLLVQNRLLQQEVDQLSSLGDISDEYAVLEVKYQREIEQLEQLVTVNQIRSMPQYQWIIEEIDILESVNTMYRSDIGNTDNEQLLGVLIDYYEKKIKLLKKLELEIERNQNHKKDETTTRNHLSI